MLSIEEVRRVARLSAFDLSEKEAEEIRPLLSETLDYINVLGELDTKSVEPTFQVTGIENVLRDDVAKASLSCEDAVSNAPRSKNCLIVTEAVIRKGHGAK